MFQTFAVPAASGRDSQSYHQRSADRQRCRRTKQRTGAGVLAFVDNAVDTPPHIKLKARFDNTDHRLWPGEFAMHASDSTLSNAVVVSGAVQTRVVRSCSS